MSHKRIAERGSEMDLLDKLCSNFCVYYKPSKDKELACGGLLVLKRLVKNGKNISLEKSGRRPGALTEEALRKVLCPACQFYKGDCDFILQEGDALPCGGFIFLGLSIERGMLCIDDVRDIE